MVSEESRSNDNDSLCSLEGCDVLIAMVAPDRTGGTEVGKRSDSDLNLKHRHNNIVILYIIIIPRPSPTKGPRGV